MTASLRVAIAGLGRWGPAHVAAFGRTPGVRVTAVADPDPARLLAHAAPGVALAPSLGALLDRDDVDAVVLATPPATHAELAESVLRAGRHVLVEKPLALTCADAERVARAAQQCPGVAMMGHLLEHHAAFEALDGVIARGELGSLVFLESRRLATRITPEEPWWALAPHDVGCCLRLAGHPTKIRVRRHAEARRAHLTFPAGLCAEIEVAFAAPRRVRELRVVGTRGTAVLNDAPEGATLVVAAEHRRATVASFAAATRPLDAQAVAFRAACLGSPLPPRCDLATGIEIVRWLAAAADSPTRPVSLAAP